MSKIKICGLTRAEDISIVNEFLPDYIGFVFAESKRKISMEQADRLKAKLSPKIKVVGVFVNAQIREIENLCRGGVVDIIQLHGDEDSAYIDQVRHLGKPVIKAVRVGDILPNIDYQGDFLLFDKLSTKGYGGLGESFDWELLKKVKSPFFLAGGVDANNIDKALKYEPFAIDVSSGVEVDGVKNRELIKEIIGKVRR